MNYLKPLFTFRNMVWCLTLFFVTCPGLVKAQDTTSVKKWNYLADVYIMFPYMDGETGIGDNLIIPIDANPGDIFDKLKMAAMLYFEAKTTKWAITSDLVYMNLNQEATPTNLIHEGEVAAKQFIWEAAGLYRLTHWLDIGVGGRLNNLNSSADGRRNVFPAGTEEFSGSSTKTWYDPIFIVRLATDIDDKWLLQFRGDVGGFGVGSDLTWQLQGYVGYRFTKVFQLTGGYRILSTDYKNGEAPKDFVFDVNEFGPLIRFGFNF